ncbi:sulfide/dihydroorotate dehydrogenase-like FAD/NAD-binding protein [Clostridium chrysemydis]|uniref:sulfide/dihydroorotate dehydrogenase-like FAD/NAD-binding protein n=1 Tax=Clostridium chrysemydis TaxID=2665504 RepID=UPI0018836B7E|nr:sulfide/dihydroorotate dehydrogenase-like FAD/NAD-binding protein [Clostridium chrysemydis]
MKITKCIDSGSEYCPCNLAVCGECILCSQLKGEKFCDCCNWNGVCIYQEFISNNSMPKEGRKIFKSKILNKLFIEENLLELELEITHGLANSLINPGSFIFIIDEEKNFYNIPISVMETDKEKNTIKILIEIKGIKTKRILNCLDKGEIKIKAPYWNGIFGIDNIMSLKDSKAIIIAKSIGIAPIIPVIRKLKQNNNDVTVYVDISNEKYDFLEEIIKKYDCNLNKTTIMNNGSLTEEMRYILQDKINNNMDLIYTAGADILTKLIIDFIDKEEGRKIKLACCNNFKMCCGEGICGACTIRYKGGVVRRYCKEQVEPRELFEGRRYI